MIMRTFDNSSKFSKKKTSVEIKHIKVIPAIRKILKNKQKFFK